MVKVSVVQVTVTVLLYIVIGFSQPSPVMKGNAAWVYDVKDGNPAMWAPQIAEFNSGNKNHTISTIYSYGGDMEYYPNLSPPFQTYFSLASEQAATIYSKIQGVKQVICVVDGRMDGGQSWSPNLSNLTVAEVEQWADITANLYCSYDQVAGIQVDLEPFLPPYAENLIVFIARLSLGLRSRDNNCVNSLYPNGRSVSMFMFAAAATSEVFEALGPNGFAIISGYDLGPNPAGTPSTPAAYGGYLTTAIKQIVANAGSKYYFSLGIPAAASDHEFTNATNTVSGKFVSGNMMYSSSSDSYLQEAFASINATQLRKNPQFLGVSLWGFSSEMTNNNFNFAPTNPFVQTGEEDYLKTNL